MLANTCFVLLRRGRVTFEAKCGEVARWVRCRGRLEDRESDRVVGMGSGLSEAWRVGVRCFMW